VALFGHGDDRPFSAEATADQYRVFFELDFVRGSGRLQSNATCLPGICFSPLPFNEAGSPNWFRAENYENGGTTLAIHAQNGVPSVGGILGEIDASIYIHRRGSEPATGYALRDPFPSLELYQFQGSRVTRLLADPEIAIPGGLGVGYLHVPRWMQRMSIFESETLESRER
jgi:hypothetical protein